MLGTPVLGLVALLVWDGGVDDDARRELHVDGRLVALGAAPDAFGAASFYEGDVSDYFFCRPGDDVKITIPTAGSPPRGVDDVVGGDDPDRSDDHHGRDQPEEDVLGHHQIGVAGDRSEECAHVGGTFSFFASEPAS